MTLLPTLTVVLGGFTVWRSYSLLGRLPLPHTDDPKFIQDALFQALYLTTLLLYAIAPLLHFTWCALLALTLRFRYKGGDRPFRAILNVLIHIAIYTIPWMIIAQDPAQRLTWLLD